jgi:hypothetical protein
VTLPVLDKLTGAERELVDAARRGLAHETDAPVRAAVLRELLLGLRGPVDPRGVRVEGARIAGTLDLDHVEAGVGLALVDCVVVNTISARAATLPWLDLSGSRIAGFDGTAVRIGHDLDLSGIRATGSGEFGVICLRDARVDGLISLSGAEIRSSDGPAVYLDAGESRGLKGRGLRATGVGDLGAVRMLGAHVSGELSLDEAVLGNEAGPALQADGVVVDGDLRLAGATVTGSGEDGAVRLLGAHVSGEVALGAAVLINDSGPGLAADRLRAGDLRIAGVTVTAAGVAIDLIGARIAGQVDLGGAVITSSGGRGLSADSIRVEDSFSGEGMKVRGSGEYGALCLLGAHIGGNCYLEGMELANDSGAALSGDRLRVDGNAHLQETSAAGSGEPGTVRLLGARIAGELYLEGARITNNAGPALYADNLHVGGSLDLTGASVAGAGEEGALRLHDAEVGSQLRAGRAELTNPSGPAFSADDLRVGTYLDLAGLQATCSSEFGALSLRAVRIDGSVTLAGADITNDGGPAVLVNRCEIRENLAMNGLRGSGAGEDATLSLVGARIGGQLAFTGVELVNRGEETLVSLEDATVDGPVFFSAELVGPKGLVRLDGFRFGSLGDATWREWLDLIRSHTAAYRPWPYQHLAAVERAAGHDGNARQILIAQQRDLQRRAPEAIGGWPARRFHWLWGALAGYGYRARRTAAALLLAVVAAGGLGLWAGHVGDAGHRAAERTADLTAARGTPCTTVELVGVGLDRGLPLSPGVRGRCDLNTGIAAGQWFTVAIWLVQAAIWALATLALVGYTGLVRKTG